MPKANPNQIRLPVMFDLTDPRQKAAYEILKNAGYGKRTPIIVDALLDSLKTNVLLSQAKESSASNMSETDIRRAVEDSMESVLNRYFLKSEASAPDPQPEPVQTPTPASVIQKNRWYPRSSQSRRSFWQSLKLCTGQLIPVFTALI